MPRVDGFIQSSDFDTLKNDDSATGQVVVPASATVASQAVASYTSDITVGQAESILNIRVKNNNEGNKWFVAGMNLSFSRSGLVGGVASGYSVIVNAVHLSGNTVRLQAFIQNPYGSTLTLGASDVFDFKVRTYVAPSF